MSEKSATVSSRNRTLTGRHGPIPVRDYAPSVVLPGARPFVWVHGGAFGSGTLDMAESHEVAMAIAAAGRPVTTVEYHLVPRFPLVGRFRMKPSTHRYPVPLDDVTDVFLDVAQRHPHSEIVLGGGSAGACLAASAALRLRDGGDATPTALLLAYGIFHATLPPMSAPLRARVPLIKRLIAPEMVRRMNLNFVGSQELFDDPAVFPGTADVQGLPPVFLMNADRDSFRASADLLAQRLTAAGVTVEETVIPETSHGFLDGSGKRGFDQGILAMRGWLDTLNDS